MIEDLKEVYQRLESRDFSLLLNAERHLLQAVNRDVKARELLLIKLNRLLQNSEENLEKLDVSEVHAWHQMAMERDKKIVAVISGLRDKSQEDLAKVFGGRGCRRSVYKQRIPGRRISV